MSINHLGTLAPDKLPIFLAAVALERPVHVRADRGQEVGFTVFRLPADLTRVLSAGARVRAEVRGLRCQYLELQSLLVAEGA